MENKNYLSGDSAESKIIFWGTGPLAESVLYSLYKSGYTPQYVVTKPDSAVGRKQIVTAPFIKTWCESKDIKVLQPDNLKDINEDIQILLQDYDLSIVASYGKIIPENILNIPKYGFLNVHPSDLPRYRGPSPIESALLAGERDITVSIMKLDAGMDSGPILIKQKFDLNMTDTAQSVELKAGQLGGELLINTLEHYISGALVPVAQTISDVTICKYIEKSQGEISLTDDIENIKNKYRAFYPWPGIFFYTENKHNTQKENPTLPKATQDKEIKRLRIKITSFDLLADNIESCILKVTPEGKSEMSFEDFKRGYM